MRERRPLRAVVRLGDKAVSLVVFVLILLLLLYSGYSIWYTRSLTNGSFLSSELAMFKPTGTDPSLEDLMELNPDVRCWLTIDGTNIDYPVVQGKTDFEYLNRDVMGRFSLAGAIFLCADNRPDFSDLYNVVYGHHIEGGAMFSDVLEFRNASFFDAHPTGTLWLADRACRIDFFACAQVDAYDRMIYQPVQNVKDAGQQKALIDYICGAAVQSRDVGGFRGEPVIALSTCLDAESYGRVLVFGKLVPMDEEEIRELEEKNLEELEEKTHMELPAEKKPALPPWLLPAGAGILIALLVLLWLIRRLRDRG
ncbi:MAG: class B sortase [Lachnospiraceae bacterium]|nr:class B sortase [Lachnospiraceae bacterium]